MLSNYLYNLLFLDFRLQSRLAIKLIKCLILLVFISWLTISYDVGYWGYVYTSQCTCSSNGRGKNIFWSCLLVYGKNSFESLKYNGFAGCSIGRLRCGYACPWGDFSWKRKHQRRGRVNKRREEKETGQPEKKISKIERYPLFAYIYGSAYFHACLQSVHNGQKN